MRIIAGELKSRLFKDPPPGPSHPMGERARGALFNRLGDLSGAVVLDAYAGSGALAFEAVSRGARRATCIELRQRAYKLLVANVAQLGLADRVVCYRANVVSWLTRQPGDDYDLILADPPYATISSAQISRLADWLPAGGRLVVSYPDHWSPADCLPPRRWDYLNLSRYARANVGVFLKRSARGRRRARRPQVL